MVAKKMLFLMSHRPKASTVANRLANHCFSLRQQILTARQGMEFKLILAA